jgi:hypothetical protein
VGSSDGTGNGSLLLVVGNTFTGKVSSTTLRELKDDGGVDVSGSLKTGVDDRRRGNVLVMSAQISVRHDRPWVNGKKVGGNETKLTMACLREKD